MKIAIVGCGALGSYYGSRLHRAGEEVHFLLRSDFQHVRRHGISITSPQGDFHIHPRTARDPAQIGPSDLVLIGLKTTANDQLFRLLPPLLHSGTIVLSLQNGLGNIERLEGWVCREQVLGGLCFICVNRSNPGEIRHRDHGQIVIGEAKGWPEPRTHDIAARFRSAGVPCKVTDNLQQSQWEKLVWNIPFNGLGVAGAFGYPFFDSTEHDLPDITPHALTTNQLLEDRNWLVCVRDLMAEIIDAANRKGVFISNALVDKMIQNTRSMRDYHPSTVIDFILGRPLEYRSMFELPFQQAAQTGASLPRLSRLCSILRRIIAHPPKTSH